MKYYYHYIIIDYKEATAIIVNASMYLLNKSWKLIKMTSISRGNKNLTVI